MQKPNPATARIHQNLMVQTILKDLDEVKTIDDVGLRAETYKRLGDAFGKLGLYTRAVDMWRHGYETSDSPAIRRVLALHLLGFFGDPHYAEIDGLVRWVDADLSLELIPHWFRFALVGGKIRVRERHSQRIDLDKQYSPLKSLIGESTHVLEVCRTILRYSLFPDEPVLITGLSGTGKELVAKALHACSPRGKGPFIALNCAEIAEGTFESAMFGHYRGAFTGAIRDHQGHIEAAHGGSLFLDEISKLPLNLQAKLLRVLEDKEVRRLGTTQTARVDVRFIAASNQDLETLAKEGQFLDDLYQRLQGLEIRVVPLLERLGDLLLLAKHFIQKHQLERQGASLSTYDIFYWLRFFHIPETVLQKVDLIDMTEEDVEHSTFLFTIGIARSEIIPSFSLRIFRLSPQLWQDSSPLNPWKGNMRGFEHAIVRARADGDLRHRRNRPFFAGVIHRGEVDILSPCYTPTELQRHDWAAALDLCKFQKEAGRLMGIDNPKRASQLLKSFGLSKKQRKS